MSSFRVKMLRHRLTRIVDAASYLSWRMNLTIKTGMMTNDGNSGHQPSERTFPNSITAILRVMLMNAIQDAARGGNRNACNFVQLCALNITTATKH
jgi:hypothetical protein